MTDAPRMIDYIRETPEVLARALAAAPESASDFAGLFAARERRRLLLVGSGTSYNAGLAAAPFLERVLGVPVHSVTAYAFAHGDTAADPSDLVVAVTQGGESTNTIEALARARELGVDTCTVTEEPASTCAGGASVTVPLLCGPEALGAKTKGYSASVLALYLMGLEAAQRTGRIDRVEYDEARARLAATTRNLPRVIEAALAWFARNREAFTGLEQCVLLGYGAHVGTVWEGALKCLETVRRGYTPYEVEEFLHGPLRSLRDGVHTLVLASSAQPGFDRARTLYGALAMRTPAVSFVGGTEDGGAAGADGRILGGCFIDDPDFSPLEYAVPLQLLAHLTCEAAGIDPEARLFADIKAALPTKARA